jgi:lysozyme
MSVNPRARELIVTDLVTQQLKKDEGFRRMPYKDTRDVLTVGYGFNLDSDGLSMEESDAVLEIRVRNRYLELATALPWFEQLDAPRQGVLLNMAYNLGVHGLLEFRQLLSALQAGDYATAADEMLSSAWAHQVGARAQRLAAQMRTGEWQ